MQDLNQNQIGVLNDIQNSGKADPHDLIKSIVDSLKGLSIVEAKVILEVAAITAESRAVI